MRAVSFNTRNASVVVDVGPGDQLHVRGGLDAGGGRRVPLRDEMRGRTDDGGQRVGDAGAPSIVAAVVGGIGNVRGARWEDLFEIGLIEPFGVSYLSSHYRDTYVFAILILVLLLAEGVLGKATVEKC